VIFVSCRNCQDARLFQVNEQEGEQGAHGRFHALAAGAGAESCSPLAGPIIGNLLTLFVIPVVYTLLTRDRSAAFGTTSRSRPSPRNDEFAHGVDEASSTPCRRRFIKPSNPA
jgi:hypothetical protein